MENTHPYEITVYYEATDQEADDIYDAIVDAAAGAIAATAAAGEEAFGFATGGPADFGAPE